VPGAVGGLLRLAPGRTWASLQAQVRQAGLPDTHVQALDAATASAHAGVPLAQGGWWFLQGGWVDPGALARWALAGLPVQPQCRVAALRPDAGGWQALGDRGQVLARADAVVLANAADAVRLLPAEAAALPRWQAWRGQLTLLRGPAPPLRVPVTGAGYALVLPSGALLCGATRQAADTDPALREADHAHNLAQLATLLPGLAGQALQVLGGRVGWRMATADRLPLLGPVALAMADGTAAPTPARRLPRVPGLYLHTALGSRGIAQAALGAEVLASWITGAPVPLAADLMDALDPGRAATGT
jgi:tRNA 5-methylaminomethyl-2-thiouridine biosynthesis bifunctional protein